MQMILPYCHIWRKTCRTCKSTKLRKNAVSIELHINIKKTEVMALNCRVPLDIEVKGSHLECFPLLTCLGSAVTSDSVADKDIKSRIGKTIGELVKLRNISKFTVISRTTEIKIYNSFVLSVLVYGPEC